MASLAVTRLMPSAQTVYISDISAYSQPRISTAKRNAKWTWALRCFSLNTEQEESDV
jgi:hypothetical protein